MATLSSPPRFLLALITTSIIFPAVCARPSAAQPAALQTAANEMAAALAHKRIRSVIVFDFSGPADNITALGQNLADNFSGALAKANAKLQLVDRSLIGQALDRERVSLQLSAAPDFAPILAQGLKVGAFVSGQLQADGSNLTLRLSCFRANGKAIKALRISWPPSEAIRESLATSPILADSGRELAGYPTAGSKGYSTPQCLHCPHPGYPRGARRKKEQGVVTLLAVVGLDGRFHDIHVEKPLPYGLTAASVRQIQGWKLQPAMGPDGKPAAVQVTIDLQFQIFR
jgi:TonB family protein